LAHLCRSDQWDLRIALLAQKQRDRQWELSTPPELSAKTDLLSGFQLGHWNAHSIFFNYGVRRYCESQKPDLVVISGYAQPAYWSLLAFCRKSNVPYITLTESHLKKNRPAWLSKLKKTVLHRYYQEAAAHLTMGSASKAYVISHGADPQRTYFFPNTIDVLDYAKQVESLRQNHREKAGITLLYVGNLTKWKGVDLLLSVFLKLVREFPSATLQLVGEGPERPRLEEIARVAPPKAVTFCGFQQPSELPKFYATSDIFVLPSRHETWGVVLLEAMASGLPVVCSDAVGASGDLVLDKETGYSFQTNNVEDFTQKMRTLLSDSTLRSQMGMAGRDLAQKWSQPIAIQGFTDAVKAVVGSS